MKKCVKCKLFKDESEFTKNPDSKDGYLRFCKKCGKEIKKIKKCVKDGFKMCRYCFKIKVIKDFNKWESNKDGYLDRCKTCLNLISEKKCTKCKCLKSIKEFHKQKCSRDGYRPVCKKCKNEENVKYNLVNRNLIRLKTNERRKTSIEKEKRHNYYIENSDIIKKKVREHKVNNKEHYRKWSRNYENRRKKENSSYKIKCLLSGRLYKSLKGLKKKSRTLDYIGCSLESLKKHLQLTALKNGYLDFDINEYNGSEYHIDHIIPCICFNHNNKSEIKQCWNYKNLQILKAKENLKKGSAI